MSQTAGVALMMNNYFHDVATALLIASGVAMWVIMKKYHHAGGQEVTDYFLKVYGSITTLAKFSVLWIILGGIPRTIFYKEFEWANAAGKGQIPALMVKHVLAFVFVGSGAYLWLKLSSRVKELKKAASSK